MSINAGTSAQRSGSVDDAVHQSMRRPLSSSLLRMLVEAPGRARDIAVGLGISASSIDRELELLVVQGLVLRVEDSEGGWYSVMDRHVISAVVAHALDSNLSQL